MKVQPWSSSREEFYPGSFQLIQAFWSQLTPVNTNTTSERWKAPAQDWNCRWQIFSRELNRPDTLSGKDCRF